MKLAWVTDIHLNFLESADRKRFYQDKDIRSHLLKR